MVSPLKRLHWMGAVSNDVANYVGGRIGPGTEFHCAHGDDDVSVNTVLDMRTADYMTLLATVGPELGMRYTTYLIPSGTGTRIVSHAAKPFLVETSDAAPDEVLAGLEQPLSDGFGAQMDILVASANAEAAALASA